MLGVWICMFLEAGCHGTHVTRPPSKNFHCSSRSGHTDFFYLRLICKAGAKRGVHLSPRTRPPGVHPLLIAASLTSSLRTPPKTGEATPQLVNVKSIEVGAPRRVLGYQISPPHTHIHFLSSVARGKHNECKNLGRDLGSPPGSGKARGRSRNSLPAEDAV